MHHAEDRRRVYADDHSHVLDLIERKAGPRSATRVGQAVGVGQFTRQIQRAKEYRRMPSWDEVEALSHELGVDPLEVVAAYARDAGVDLVPDLTFEQRQVAEVVGRLPVEKQRALLACLTALVEFADDSDG